MKNQNTQQYLTSTFTSWMRGGCKYLCSAEDKTQMLFEQGRVHTNAFSELYTYERHYIVKQLIQDGVN